MALRAHCWEEECRTLRKEQLARGGRASATNAKAFWKAESYTVKQPIVHRNEKA